LIFSITAIQSFAIDKQEITVSPDGEISSISYAISIANDGDTIIVNSGTYHEHIVIDKKLRLIGTGNPEIIGDEKGTIIKVRAPDCLLKGFNISGSGHSLYKEDSGIETENSPNTVIENNTLTDVLFGIYVKNSPHTVIRNNYIRGKDLDLPDRGDGIRLWYSDNAKIINNTLIKTRDLVMWWSSHTYIKGNKVKYGRYGLHYMYSNHNVFRDNTFIGNSVGGFLMYSNDIKFYNNVFAHNQGLASGYGVGFKDLDDVVAENNLFIDNRVGIYLDNSPHLINSWNRLEGNVIAFNDIGASLMPSIERNIIVKNSFIENSEQVEVRGGGYLKANKWYMDGRGNYWSDYAGYDVNNDGIGDISYVYASLFENIIDKYPDLRLFLYSPSAQAIELASEALPLIKPEPKLTDKYPLISPSIPVNFDTGNTDHGPDILILSIIITFLPLFSYIYIRKADWIRK